MLATPFLRRHVPCGSAGNETTRPQLLQLTYGSHDTTCTKFIASLPQRDYFASILDGLGILTSIALFTATDLGPEKLVRPSTFVFCFMSLAIKMPSGIGDAWKRGTFKRNPKKWRLSFVFSSFCKLITLSLYVIAQRVDIHDSNKAFFSSTCPPTAPACATKVEERTLTRLSVCLNLQPGIKPDPPRFVFAVTERWLQFALSPHCSFWSEAQYGPCNAQLQHLVAISNAPKFRILTYCGLRSTSIAEHETHGQQRVN